VPGLFAAHRADLEYGEIFQQRNDADDDHDNTRDLFGTAVERQHIDQIQNENNDKKRDQNTDEHCDSPDLGAN
jgi:hypothetical protein